jgi:hypothetical protein
MDGVEETITDEELCCPICGYSLRGLVEPRCPECGYQFEWDALRVAAKSVHPYLYEHGRGVAIGRAVKTFFHGLRPEKFWGTLSAAHQIRPRRLMTYWMMTAMVIVLGMVLLPYGGAAVSQAQRASQIRWQMSTMLASPKYAGDVKQIVKRFGSTQAFLDAYAPLPQSRRFWLTLPMRIQWRGVGRGYGESLVYMVYAAGFAVLWPWVTLALLGIFVQSRSRAKIRWAQLMRCVVYCADVIVFSGVLIAVLNASQLMLEARFQGVIPGALLLVVFVSIFAGYRLFVALSRYLRMPHAGAVVISTQVIAVLLLLTVMPHPAADWVVRLIKGL